MGGVMDIGLVVRIDDEFNLHLQDVLMRYRQIKGKRLSKSELMLKIIQRDAFIINYCMSDRTKAYFKIQ